MTYFGKVSSVSIYVRDNLISGSSNENVVTRLLRLRLGKRNMSHKYLFVLNCPKQGHQLKNGSYKIKDTVFRRQKLTRIISRWNQINTGLDI